MELSTSCLMAVIFSRLGQIINHCCLLAVSSKRKSFLQSFLSSSVKINILFGFGFFFSAGLTKSEERNWVSLRVRLILPYLRCSLSPEVVLCPFCVTAVRHRRRQSWEAPLLRASPFPLLSWCRSLEPPGWSFGWYHRH